MDNHNNEIKEHDRVYIYIGNSIFKGIVDILCRNESRVDVGSSCNDKALFWRSNNEIYKENPEISPTNY